MENNQEFERIGDPESDTDVIEEPASPEVGGADGTAEENDTDKIAELSDTVSLLQARLLTEQIKVALLLSGILGEKLEDGTALALGLCDAGKSPQNAAEEIMTAYPHLKAIRQEIPQFSAGGSGSGDGFSAIRRIFSNR